MDGSVGGQMCTGMHGWVHEDSGWKTVVACFKTSPKLGNMQIHSSPYAKTEQGQLFCPFIMYTVSSDIIIL